MASHVVWLVSRECPRRYSFTTTTTTTLESDALDRSAKLTYLYSVRKRNGLNKQKIFCIVMFDKGKTQVLSLIINY